MNEHSEYHETTPDEALAENIGLIKSFLAGNTNYLSTSQKIMVGLALCRPELLEEAQYPARQIEQAWKRLDGEQREAIAVWAHAKMRECGESLLVSDIDLGVEQPTPPVLVFKPARRHV